MAKVLESHVRYGCESCKAEATVLFYFHPDDHNAKSDCIGACQKCRRPMEAALFAARVEHDEASVNGKIFKQQRFNSGGK